MKMPISKPGGAQFRGPTSSHQYNDNEDKKYLDLIELYKQNKINDYELKEAMKYVLYENHALSQYVNMLENRLQTLEDRLESLGGSSWWNGHFFKTSSIENMTTTFPNILQDQDTKTARCNIQSDYRFATLPIIHEIPKTHQIGKNGETILPKELDFQIGRTNQEGNVIENDITFAFDGKETTHWRREVIYDDENSTEVPESEDLILEITLPLHMINDLNINTIYIHPYPEYGVHVKNIEVHYNNAWQTIKGFQQEDLASSYHHQRSPKRKWYFPSIAAQKVRITLEQHQSFIKNGKRIFVLGAQEIGIYLSTFENDDSIILTPFDMKDVGLYNIESIEHVFSNRQAFSYTEAQSNELEGNIYEYEIMIEQNGILVPITNTEWSNQTATTLWVKTYLRPDPNSHNDVNPCLHAIRMHYTKL